MTNLIDRTIAYFSPQTGVRRAQMRRVLNYYESGRKDKLRKQRKSTGSGNAEVNRAGRALRDQARHLEENHDLATGILNILTANIAGHHGVTIEPQPRTRSGEIHADLARQINTLMRDWSKRPEVTWRHDWPAAQRMACRSWVRDGEVLSQLITGTLRTLDHGTRVPFSLELLEADYLPMDMDDVGKGIIQGVETNGWGRAVAYHLYKQHPGDVYRAFVGRGIDLKRVPAGQILHMALRHRLHQVRGVSVFASVLARLDDLKDYEESERIAAKVAASMAAAIKKGAPDDYSNSLNEDGESEARDMRFRPGMIFDDLRPGEDIVTIDSNRPNPNLPDHRRGQLRAVASGVYCSHSSVAKDYDSSYSAQRQELVESWGVYGILQSEFIGQFVQPVFESLLSAAVASGQLVLPADLDPQTLDDALFLAPQMPWIDPDKEAKAWERLEQNGHASGPEIIRRRGRNPADVIEQESAWRRQWRDKGELITADPAVEHQQETETDDEPSQRVHQA